MENQNYKGSNPTTPLAEEEPDFARSATIDENLMDEEAAAKEHLTSSDPTKVKFISANSEYTRKNGDAKVDIENVQRSVGMGKDELMKYANDPFWIRLRMTLFVLFWVVWVAMLVGSVVIIFMAPRCPPAPQLDWWQKTVVYKTLVPSFKDSNGDGYGDLNGLIEKLDYLKENDVNTLQLNPIYPTTANHYEYEVIDFKAINPRLGTMEDFENLIKAADEKGMKVILEFIPNHSSVNHPWFLLSKNKTKPYTDYYIWADENTANADKKPNNWKNVFGESAWVFDEDRKQFYLSQFFPEQADLNLRSSDVQKELKEILKFWLDKGVDGFKINHVQFLYESQTLEDEPVLADVPEGKNEYNRLSHDQTLNHPDNLEQLKEWRNFLDEYSKSNETTEGHRRIILTDVVANDVNETATYFGNSTSPISDIPFYFGLDHLPKASEAQYLSSSIKGWLGAVPKGLWPNWVLGGFSNETGNVGNKPQRLATKVGPHFSDALHAIALLLKGTPIVYYGDEIGMENVEISDSEAIDPVATRTNTESSDVVKTPMQWSNASQAGFTSGTNSFLRINSDYQRINVDTEKLSDSSHLSLFKRLVAMRKEPAIQFGDTEVKDIGNNIFGMTRIRKGTPGYLVLVNFGGNSTIIDVASKMEKMPENGRVELVSYPSPNVPLSDKGYPKVTLSSVSLGGYQTAVISFVPKSGD